jgi:hypothetical protein
MRVVVVIYFPFCLSYLEGSNRTPFPDNHVSALIARSCMQSNCPVYCLFGSAQQLKVGR